MGRQGTGYVSKAAWRKRQEMGTVDATLSRGRRGECEERYGCWAAHTCACDTGVQTGWIELIAICMRYSDAVARSGLQRFGCAPLQVASRGYAARCDDWR